MVCCPCPCKPKRSKKQHVRLDGLFSPGYYTDQVKLFGCREDALKELGVGCFVRGHCARACKKHASVTFLRCHLSCSQPQCTWRGILQEMPDGTVSFRQHATEHRDHNERSKLQGKYGFSSLAERRAMETLMRDSAYRKPKEVHRKRKLAGSEEARRMHLRKVQTIVWPGR